VVVAREDISLAYLRNAGIEAQLSADCALLLLNQETTEADNTTSNHAIFVPNQLYKWHPNYRERQAELDLLIHGIFEQLLEKQKRIIILPQTFPYPNGIEDFDYLIERFGRKRVQVISNASPLQQIELIRTATCLVGMRYHSVVFAAIANTPSISLGYERKMQGFNRRFYGGAAYFDLATSKLGGNTMRLPEPAKPLQEQVLKAAADIEACLRKHLETKP
jgi:polysaccharide pyruvyl transferase WcaK-like protein